MTNHTLGARIRRLRERAKLSQQALAVACQVAVTQVSRWETGVSEPSLDSVRALARALGASYEEIIGK
jgi:transcriptional regulator with XRE-family HTH domain